MLRRNGKPRSCEPCRISKIRCDHRTPKCEKCEARGIAEQCFYHPAPMTKPPGTPRRQSTEPRKRVVKPRYSETRPARDHEIPLTSPTTSFRSDDLGAVASQINSIWPTPPDSAGRSVQAAQETKRSFYLGSTSYASVFAEEQPIPDSFHEQPPERISATPSVRSVSLTGSRHCQMGIGQAIISKLTPFSVFEKAMGMYFSENKATALVGPLIMPALPQLRKDIYQLSRATGADAHAAYAEITRNTARPFKVPSTMLACDLYTLFTGQNLRWEILGLVLAIGASQAQYTSPTNPMFTLESGEKIDKDDFIEDKLHASGDCITLCQVHGAVNDIMVWLVYYNMLAMSNFYGDNYHGVWRRMGDSVSILFAEGMHCEETFEVPFFLRESRRRIYAATYKSDKMLATFFGRPPMMAGRYSNRKLPLDLSDKTMTTGNPDLLNEALSKLDGEGWNTEGQIYPASLLRLRSLLASVRERVLEISLAGQTDGDVPERLQAISEEFRQMWESLPSHLRYDLYDEETVWTSLEPSITLRILSPYLDYLHTHFHMQRILRRRTQLAIPALLEVCMKLVSTVLVINKQRNQSYSIQRHFPSMILFYCLPSAGVLALELRRCTLENVPLPNNISRADLIRNLSVLISCLEWAILPGDGNHKLCSELNKMLALVLDEVLNYQPPAASESQAGAGEGGEDGAGGFTSSAGSGGSNVTSGGAFFDLGLIDGMEPIPTESEDFLNWLDGANWNNTYLF